MSLSQADDFMEAFGTGPPAISSRSADLLILAGSLTRRQVPLVREVYARMLEPRWVIAWGACAISGGAYDNYSTLSGFSRVVPVDLIVHGCPPNVRFEHLPGYPDLLSEEAPNVNRYYGFGILSVDGVIYHFLTTPNYLFREPDARFVGAKLI